MNNIIISKISNEKVVAEKRAVRLKKTILTNAFEEAFKSVKNRVLSGNIGNSIDKLKKIDEQKIKEKIKNEIDANKDKVKNKLKKLFDNN